MRRLSDADPTIRCVVVNTDGGVTTRRCLESLLRLDWPRESLQIVLVDNASIDGLVSVVRMELPGVEIVELLANAGAGAFNAALGDRSGIDYVALVANTAVVTPGWLRPLVDVMEADRSLGAASPKVLMSPRFVACTIDTPTFVPPRHDDRPELGVRISGVEVDGVHSDLRDGSMFEGVYGIESGPSDEPLFRWTRGRVRICIPVAAGSSPPGAVRICLAAEAPKVVIVGGDEERSEMKVTPEPTWFDVALGPAFDLIDSAGAAVAAGGFRAARGHMERDTGAFDDPVEVFAWCDVAVLLSTRFLEDVGPFDADFSSCYADADLSWRGRLAGWRYAYVPSSLVRNAPTTVSTSDSSASRQVEDRDRLLMLVRNAPAPVVRDALRDLGGATARQFRRDVLSPLLRGDRPRADSVGQGARTLVGFGRRLPRALAHRRRIRREKRVDDADMMPGMVNR